MRVDKIIEVQQPDIHKRLNKQQGKKHKRVKKEDSLSFKDIEELMRHDSYRRGRGGAIKQR